MTVRQIFKTVVNCDFAFLIYYIRRTYCKGNDPLDQKNTVPPFFRFWGDVIQRAKHISFVNSSHICIIVGNSFWTWYGLHTTIFIFTLYIRRLCAMEIRKNIDRLTGLQSFHLFVRIVPPKIYLTKGTPWEVHM